MMCKVMKTQQYIQILLLSFYLSFYLITFANVQDAYPKYY